MKIASAVSALLIAIVAAGCAPKLIPGLDIDLVDNPDHRALIKVLNAYQDAFEKKDVAALVALASDRFYEDLGTPETEDDYDYKGLNQHFAEHFKLIKQLQLNVNIKAVQVEGDKAEVDYRYITRYLMDLPAGEKWQVTDEINRMELVREGKTWKVVSGY